MYEMVYLPYLIWHDMLTCFFWCHNIGALRYLESMQLQLLSSKGSSVVRFVILKACADWHSALYSRLRDWQAYDLFALWVCSDIAACPFCLDDDETAFDSSRRRQLLASMCWSAASATGRWQWWVINDHACNLQDMCHNLTAYTRSRWSCHWSEYPIKQLQNINTRNFRHSLTIAQWATTSWTNTWQPARSRKMKSAHDMLILCMHAPRVRWYNVL